MNPLIEKLEKLESEVERLNAICTTGVQSKIDKLNAQISKVFGAISKSKAAIAEYEDRYGCDFEWEA